jgi:hypothetical protein
MVFVGMALVFIGVAGASWWNHILRTRPAASDLPIFLAAALVAGGALLTVVSIAMYFVGGNSHPH